MLIISTREFRERQKKYLDLVDNNEQVIVQRGKNKAYVLVRISENDRFFADPNVKERILHSIAQADRGETVEVNNINELLELEVKKKKI